MQGEVSIKKKTLVAVSAILVVVLIGFGILYAKHGHLRSPVVFLPDPQQVTNETHERQAMDPESNISLDSLQEVSGGNATNAVSYQNALALYKGNVMQFNTSCRANPVILSLAVKSVVMLDNRSGYQRAFTVGDRHYSVAPYDYILASFNDPGQYAVSCDSLESVGIISVQ